MSPKKPKPPQHFPVMDGAQPAPREDQIAGIVERVWADSRVFTRMWRFCSASG